MVHGRVEVRPAGIEPAQTAPEAVALSVRLRAHATSYLQIII